jgi:hypothetical protein
MAVAEITLPLSVSVTQTVFTTGCDNDRDPVPVMRGVTEKRITVAVTVGTLPLQNTPRAVGL